MYFLNWPPLCLLPTHPCWQPGCICPIWLRWGPPLPGSAPPPLPVLTLDTGCGLFIFTVYPGQEWFLRNQQPKNGAAWGPGGTDGKEVSKPRKHQSVWFLTQSSCISLEKRKKNCFLKGWCQLTELEL